MNVIHQTPGMQTSIHAMIGKRAVITPTRVEIVSPIESGSGGVEMVYNLMRQTYPDRPCAVVFDGWIRAEYGRPMTRTEIEEALVSFGML